jgi:signal transduction histidine kinase
MDEFLHGGDSQRDGLSDRLNAIARLVIGLSHEMNNALGAMQSNVDIMRRRLPGDAPLQANLNHIQNATGHVMELTRILQLYTQRVKTELDDVNLPPLLAGTVRTFKSMAPENCRILVRPVRGNLHVSTCPTLLAHAILGILQNAVDALQGNPGSITIETAIGLDRVRASEGLLFGERPPENSVLIEISDTGEGMSPDVIKHCLEPFFSTRIRARGLGLAPAVGLTFHCNAAVHITSSPGQGTTVRLLLPRQEE